MTLRRRAYLSEEVKPGTVLDNGIIRIHRGDKFIWVTDLRFAGLRGKKVDLFMIHFVPTARSSKPILKMIGWLKRARSYPQALSVAHEALKEAETLAVQNSEKPPWLEERVNKSFHVPASGRGSTGIVNPNYDPLGTLKSTTRGRTKTSQGVSNEGGRPKVRSIKPKASAPQGSAPRSVSDPKRGNVTNFPELREHSVNLTL